MVKRCLAASVLWAALAGAVHAQPAHAPHYLQVVTTAGARQDVNPDRRELTLLQTELTTRRLRVPRNQLRMVCGGRCPATLPARRSREDVIEWQDGRRTTGTVFIFDDMVEQNGARAGRFEDVVRIELGSAPVSPTLLRELEPVIVGAHSEDPWSGGDTVVFRQPWVTLTADTLTLNGQPPRPRGGNLRFLRFNNRDYQTARQPWTDIDTVVWRDGSRTTGTLTISGGEVRQAGRRPRSLRDVAYIELARQPQGSVR